MKIQQEMNENPTGRPKMTENVPDVIEAKEIMTTDEARAIARELVEIVKELGWSKNFGGEKDHLEIEAWQFIAAKDGATPSCPESNEIRDSEGILIGFEAHAELIRDGIVISKATHECTFKEKNWASKARYALKGMAQTRAMSRVCRNRYAWIARMGGFSGTPADEMDGEFINNKAIQETFPGSKTVEGKPETPSTKNRVFTGIPVPKKYWSLRKTDRKAAQELLGGDDYGYAKNPKTEQWEITKSGEQTPEQKATVICPQNNLKTSTAFCNTSCDNRKDCPAFEEDIPL